jgi:hypothetical protein
MKMLRRMLIHRRVATSHMPTLHAHPQMDPRASHLQTLLASLRRRLHFVDMIQMRTFHAVTFLAPDSIPLAQNPDQSAQT